MLKNRSIWTVSILATMIGLTACQQKKDESKTQEEKKDEIAIEAQMQRLQGGSEKVPIQLPACDDKNCPEISIDRLHTNQFVLDNLIDQAIVKNLSETLELFEPDKKAKTQKDQSVDQAASEAKDLKTPVQSLAEQIQPYIDNFISLDEELKSLGAGHQISLSISPKILNSEGPLATVVLNTSNYLGGAHGSSSQTYYNFDLKQQKQISLDQILLPNKKQNLNKLAHEAFKVWVIDSKLAENVEQYEQAWPFKLSDNFYLGRQGLILQYGEYEIGPYVVGLPRLTIPYEQLQGIIKHEYLSNIVQAAKPSEKK